MLPRSLAAIEVMLSGYCDDARVCSRTVHGINDNPA
jgi:hypothetical protein